MLYKHVNNESSMHLADGAYCLSGFNGNISIHFFQELPNIPKEIHSKTHIKSSDEPYTMHEDKESITRFFVGKIQMNPMATAQLIKNLQDAINDIK